MKYRAVCPGCGVRFPRWFWFKWLPHVRWRCAACGCAYRVNPWWEWTADIGFGILWALCAALAMFHFVSWAVAAVAVAAVFVLAYALFPYITPCDLAEPAPRDENKPPQ
jgi:hypothetical protein